MIDAYKEAGIPPHDVFAQSFNVSPLAMVLTVSNCCASMSSRSCRYWLQSVATASGKALACLSAVNLSDGNR
jgi:hypothetical protein